MRVLKPAAGQTGSGSPDLGDADELSAVREVNLAYENVKVVDCLDLSPEGVAAWEAALKRWGGGAEHLANFRGNSILR